MTEELAPGHRCGVRLTRHGVLQLADSGDLSIRAGDAVVVADAQGEELATVVVAPDQLLECDGLPSVTVVRLATEQDLLRFGQRAAADRGLLATITGQPGSSARALDAWLTPDGGRLHLLVGPPGPADADKLSFEIARLLGLPVDVHVGETIASSVSVSGPIGSRMRSHWANFLVAPGSDATVRNDLAVSDFSAAEFIQRIFGVAGATRPGGRSS